MRSTKQRLVTAAGLALLASIAVTGPALAQQLPGQSGTGGAAGKSPPMDEAVVGGAGASSMDAPPPLDRSMGAPAPEPMNAPPPDPDKQDEGVPAPDTENK